MAHDTPGSSAIALSNHMTDERPTDEISTVSPVIYFIQLLGLVTAHKELTSHQLKRAPSRRLKADGVPQTVRQFTGASADDNIKLEFSWSSSFASLYNDRLLVYYSFAQVKSPEVMPTEWLTPETITVCAKCCLFRFALGKEFLADAILLQGPTPVGCLLANPAPQELTSTLDWKKIASKVTPVYLQSSLDSV